MTGPGEGFRADEGVIEGVANMLRNGSDSVEALGASTPGPPDAGHVSGVMGALMSKLVDAAGEVSPGVAAAAAAVQQGAKIYVAADDAAKAGLPKVNSGTHGADSHQDRRQSRERS